jgi:hypothetical protein
MAARPESLPDPGRQFTVIRADIVKGKIRLPDTQRA